MDVLELVNDDGIKPYPCNLFAMKYDPRTGTRTTYQCQKAFSRRSDLRRHQKIHYGDKPFLCEVPGCGKRFIQRSALSVHSRIHTGERPHICEVPACGKRFADSSSLARHRRTHSGKRPYKCSDAGCGKAFCRRSTLSKHYRSKHSIAPQPDAWTPLAQLPLTTPAYTSSLASSSRASHPWSTSTSSSGGDPHFTGFSPVAPAAPSPSPPNGGVYWTQSSPTDHSFYNGSMPVYVDSAKGTYNEAMAPVAPPPSITTDSYFPSLPPSSGYMSTPVDPSFVGRYSWYPPTTTSAYAPESSTSQNWSSYASPSSSTMTTPESASFYPSKSATAPRSIEFGSKMTSPMSYGDQSIPMPSNGPYLDHEETGLVDPHYRFPDPESENFIPSPTSSAGSGGGGGSSMFRYSRPPPTFSPSPYPQFFWNGANAV